MTSELTFRYKPMEVADQLVMKCLIWDRIPIERLMDIFKRSEDVIKRDIVYVCTRYASDDMKEVCQFYEIEDEKTTEGQQAPQDAEMLGDEEDENGCEDECECDEEGCGEDCECDEDCDCAEEHDETSEGEEKVESTADFQQGFVMGFFTAFMLGSVCYYVSMLRHNW